MVYEAELLAGDYPCSPIGASAAEPQRPVTWLYPLVLFCLLILQLYVWQNLSYVFLNVNIKILFYKQLFLCNIFMWDTKVGVMLE